MKIISWNVNGLRANVKKGFLDIFNALDADIFCIQETKMQPGQLELQLPGYYQYFNSAERKGYSGTAVFTRIKPLSIVYDIGIEEHSLEGRVITLEFGSFYLVNVYTPNAQDKLARIDYRMSWEDGFRKYVMNLDTKKPVIICGDLNVAHEEIDLKNPDSNRSNAGFSDEEREKMTILLSSGFTDTFRWFYPEKEEAYTWWTYRFNARANNIGWRIDYFLVSNRLISIVEDSVIHSEIFGSDHCPVELMISDKIKLIKEENTYEIYTDGSYIDERVGYGAVILKNGKFLKEIFGEVTDPVFMGSRQVGGEIMAIMEALTWAEKEGISKVHIFYDFENLKKWVSGEYMAKIPMSIKYRDFIQSTGIDVQWVKVAAHSGVEWNERADKLAKTGALSKIVKVENLIDELEEVAQEFSVYLDGNDYDTEFLRIYNDMYAKISIKENGRMLGCVSIYNTKKLHLEPKFHEIKEDSDKKQIENYWNTFKRNYIMSI